jgi:thiosulfate dehydrogenase [quinone] large subunit
MCAAGDLREERCNVAQIELVNTDRIRLPLPLGAITTQARFAWLWLPVRVYLGIQWLSSGWGKLRSPAWMGSGKALAGFWAHAVYAPVGGTQGVVYYGWYHAFLQFALTHHWALWFGKLIACSEAAVGLLLLLGAFTGLAALSGAFLNFNYLLAGSASANPVLCALAILLLLSWRISGLVGLDFWLLRSRRMPWAPLLHADRPPSLQ